MSASELRDIATRVNKQRDDKSTESATQYMEALYTEMRKAAEDGQYTFTIGTNNIHNIIPDAPHQSSIWGGYSSGDAYDRTKNILDGMVIILGRNGYRANASPNLTLSVSWNQ